MKFYTKIPKKLEFYDEYMHGDYTRAWNHLERAHIIAQKYPYQHTFVHWKMLQFGFKIKNRKEIFGQIPRLVFGGVKSFVGKIPVGNPGGANVPPLKPFPISEDIQEVFKNSGIISH